MYPIYKFDSAVEYKLDNWLTAWGYTEAPDSLHLDGDKVRMDHPYLSEIKSLLDKSGSFAAQAVFDVDGVPTICFLECDNSNEMNMLQSIRERAWNQNLVSVVMTISGSHAVAAPAALHDAKLEQLSFEDASLTSPFSIADIQSGELFTRFPDWFEAENRVDRVLLNNLELLVRALCIEGLEKTNAQMLMAQVMFVAYLEHRGIVGDIYRRTRQVNTMANLITEKDRLGVAKLMDSLKVDFNGDVLEPIGANDVWEKLSDKALVLVDDFLRRVDLRDGQQDFWRYDFRYIPVELISGIYESFLSEKKKDEGAYYTPRNLAVLAVDQAFAGSHDILTEKIYDGACGSGILLTTAYRRMLALAEAKTKQQLTFEERIKLLKSSIFGSDLNRSACRVTSFSLYLSVLENLRPSDIAKLTEQGKSKLPTLANSNIFYEDKGDFFSESNPLVGRGDFTIFLSNPPWVEPDIKDIRTADIWAKQQGYKIPRRQLCAAFMMRALTVVDPVRGRFCFILPVSVLGASTSQEFVKQWLKHCQVDTIINFGDLRKLLFDNAKQPALVVVARPRAKLVQQPETFEYWTPKADVSYAFNRLTLHTSDRNIVQTQQLRQDNAILTNLYWGTPQDLTFMTRLEMQGTLGDVLQREGWNTRKGFHKKDTNVEMKDLQSVDPIRHLPFLNARRFGMNGPLLDKTVLEAFPEDLTHVPGLSQDLVASFCGPRIVFKDGMTPEREVCAAFSSEAFSFNSSTAVITAPNNEADVLRFLSVYLHSDLVRYLLLLNAYQVSFERERVTLQDIKGLPFVHPADHVDHQKAFLVVNEIAGFMIELEATPAFERLPVWIKFKPRAEQLIADYFAISPLMFERIQEVMRYVLPSIQPSSVDELNTTLQQRVSDSQLQSYTSVLLQELGRWRDAMGGEGSFKANITAGSANACGALGILRLDVLSGNGASHINELNIADTAVFELVRKMRKHDLLPAKLHGNFHLASDVVIRYENSLYLVKPMVQRLWLQGEAVRDAQRIVSYVQEAIPT